jgi:hypothetical protein
MISLPVVKVPILITYLKQNAEYKMVMFVVSVISWGKQEYF